MEKKVLIVEDESLVALEIQNALKKYDIQSCFIADSVEEAMELLEKCTPDLVLLDIYLRGELTGIEGCKHIKKRKIPVIFLTAYSDDDTLQKALECEPDAYLVKPFRRAELYAAIETVLKKQGQNRLVKICNDIFYDKRRCVIIRGDEEIPLTKKEMLLLELLLQNRGKMVHFDTIEYEIWPETPITESTRRSLIHRLRQKSSKDCIRTLSGIGVILE